MNMLRGFLCNLRYKCEGEAGTTQGKAFLQGRAFDLTCPEQAERFRRDFRSQVWITYREGISTPQRSDLGWGCSIRVAQMMLAEVMRRVIIRREQQRKEDCFIEKEDFLNVIIAFLDDPAVSPKNYSLSNILTLREICKPGQFHSVRTSADIMVEMTHRHKRLGFENLEAQVFSAALYRDRLLYLLTGNYGCTCPQQNQYCPLCLEPKNQVLAMVSVDSSRPGLTTKYWQSIKLVLGSPSSVGAMGGRDNRALYFVGYCDNELFYLDPHLLRAELGLADKSKLLDQFFCQQIRKVHYTKLKTNLVFGFYLKTVQEVFALCKLLQSLPEPLLKVSNDRPKQVKSLFMRSFQLADCEKAESGDSEAGSYKNSLTQQFPSAYQCCQERESKQYSVLDQKQRLSESFEEDRTQFKQNLLSLRKKSAHYCDRSFDELQTPQSQEARWEPLDSVQAMPFDQAVTH